MHTLKRFVPAAAGALILSVVLPAAAGTIAVDRPATHMVWDTFAIGESQVHNNAAPGAPADGSTDSAATGAARFEYDRETDHLNYTVSWQNLAGPLQDIRVHGPATASQTSDDVLFDVLKDGVAVVGAGVGRTSGSYAGTLDLANPPDMTCGCSEFDPETAARAILNSLLQGRAYLNLGTSVFPTGEIRGNFPVAAVAGEPGPTPVPLPPGAWPAMATLGAFGAARLLRTRRPR